jgi:hypothetical protein
MSMNHLLRNVIVGLFLVPICAAPAFAAGAGLQAGASINPDDFVIGIHFKSEPVAESLIFVPSVEAGFGDVTMIAGNADLHYIFKSKSKLAPYAGGGLTINWFDNDGGSDTEVGGSLLGGIKINPKFSLEAKLGLGDVPDWKFLLVWR